MFFVFSLFWLIQLILVHVNFVTSGTTEGECLEEDLLNHRVGEHESE
jgi:hypothetical protein